MKIVLATNNIGKLKEFNSLFESLSIHAVPQSEFNIQDAEETGLTFVENALIKARHAANLSKLPTIADDSGLCVPALNGAPGIYSARYAGMPSNSHNNISKLLIDLADKNRDAYFYCCLVYLRHEADPTPIICEGRWHGKIAHKPSGNDGFGYDPAFFIPTLNKTAAEISQNEKNTLSHRAIALKALTNKLREMR